MEIQDGWEYRWGISPFDTRGHPLWIFDETENPGWHRLKELPSNPPGRNGQKNLWLRLKLPDPDIEAPKVVTNTILVNVEVYLDGRKIYNFGDIDERGNSRFRGLKWHVINLPRDFQNKFIYFRFHSPYFNIGFTKQVFLHSQTSFLLSVLQTEADNVVLSSTFLFLSLFFIYIYARQLASKAFLYFSFSLICSATYIIRNTFFKDIFFDYPLFWTTSWMLAIFYLPYTIIGTYLHIFGQGWRSMIRILYWVSLINAILFTPVYATYVLLNLAGPAWDLAPVLILMSQIFLFISLVAYILLLVDAAVRAYRHEPFARTFLAGWVSFLLLSLGLYVSELIVILPKMDYSLQWGMLAFSVSVVIILVRYFIQTKTEMYQKVAHYSHRLERMLKEKAQITSELHDGIGGIMTNISLLTEVARQKIPANTEIQALSSISSLSREGLSEIRSFMKSLDEHETNINSLMADFRIIGKKTLEPYGINFEISMTNQLGNFQISSLVFLNVFRIFKESLTNIVKHANATRVAVELTVDASCLSLVIGDNGTGIQTRDEFGRGLMNMKSRAEEMNGSVTINSENGTQISLTIPTRDVIADNDGQSPY